MKFVIVGRHIDVESVDLNLFRHEKQNVGISLLNFLDTQITNLSRTRAKIVAR